MPKQITEHWASLQERLACDEKLSKVLQSLEVSLSSTDGEPQRPRLKVPYATTSAIVKEGIWN